MDAAHATEGDLTARAPTACVLSQLSVRRGLGADAGEGHKEGDLLSYACVLLGRSGNAGDRGSCGVSRMSAIVR